MKKLEVLLIAAMIFTASWAVLPQALARASGHNPLFSVV